MIKSLEKLCLRESVQSRGTDIEDYHIKFMGKFLDEEQSTV
jgi:hypothetical protein